MIPLKKILLSFGLTVLATTGTLFSSAAPATALDCTVSNRPCVVMYYNSNYGGAYFPTSTSISNLAGYTFMGFSGDPGRGQGVKNNAASAQFRADDNFYLSSGTIFFNSGYAGPCDTFRTIEYNWVSSPRLARTYNDNASVLIKAGYGTTHPSGCYAW
ncbi:peptidase M23 [Streptomyces verrucosisporus]|uniref:peptidase M23 n=1 Tax=Streptomyces verrucosisporus TaxID=1695161 RepID=UPI0019CF8DA5|nr:peptidase M23 [Streptomyces verrucosisporus]MBN3930709.1 peptidase M23 [Streptomyces verrucosisporus]